VGTGGAGFRFLYAAFLQQAADLLDDARLARHAEALAAVGDRWREFALDAARMSRGKRGFEPRVLGEHLRGLAEAERGVFEGLLADARGE
jgi:hypothetical protein